MGNGIKNKKKICSKDPFLRRGYLAENPIVSSIQAIFHLTRRQIQKRKVRLDIFAGVNAENLLAHGCHMVHLSHVKLKKKKLSIFAELRYSKLISRLSFN